MDKLLSAQELSIMRLWGRVVRRRTACLWLLLFGLALFTLALSDLFSRKLDQSHHKPGPPRRPLQRIPSGPDLELIVDSRDPALELGADLAPLQSLQEDQLLFVPSTENTRNPAQKKGTYKVLLPGTNKESRATASPTLRKKGKEARRHPEGAGRDTVQKYGFNEVLSERISVHRALPDARHPE